MRLPWGTAPGPGQAVHAGDEAVPYPARQCAGRWPGLSAGHPRLCPVARSAVENTPCPRGNRGKPVASHRSHCARGFPTAALMAGAAGPPKPPQDSAMASPSLLKICPSGHPGRFAPNSRQQDSEGPGAVPQGGRTAWPGPGAVPQGGRTALIINKYNLTKFKTLDVVFFCLSRH